MSVLDAVDGSHPTASEADNWVGQEKGGPRERTAFILGQG